MPAKRFRWIVIAASIAVALLIARLTWPYLGWIVFGAKTGLMNYDDFSVSGMVVDGNGAPIAARVQIQKVWKRKMGFESESESRYQSINGKFNFEVSNCDAVYLYFLKEGHRMEIRSFTKGGRYRDLQVVMRAKGNAKGTFLNRFARPLGRSVR